MMRPVVLTLVLMLSACTPLAPGVTVRTPATDITGATSRQAIIAARGQNLLIGQVLILRQAGRTALIAEVGQARHSGQGRLRIDSAWQEGRELPFRPATRSEWFCTRPGQCRGVRTGSFVLSRDEFDAALHAGLSATLIGPDDVVELRFPPHLFVEARDRALAAGLWPP
jgi:hypothetical protein